MQSLTRVVEAIEKELVIEVNGRTMYRRSPNTVKIERNGPAWRQSLLHCKTHLSFVWLNICFEKKQSESYASYYIFKATFDWNYCKFYSLFGNLFQLNMKSLCNEFANTYTKSLWTHTTKWYTMDFCS